PRPDYRTAGATGRLRRGARHDFRAVVSGRFAPTMGYVRAPRPQPPPALRRPVHVGRGGAAAAAAVAAPAPGPGRGADGCPVAGLGGVGSLGDLRVQL